MGRTEQIAESMLPRPTSATVRVPRRRLRERFSSSAPRRPPARAMITGFITALVALLALAGLTRVSGTVFFIPPLAASMALVVGAPALPLAQPRNVIGGQALSAAVGATVGIVGGSLWAGAAAGAVAIAAMTLCRVPHSPAAATAVIGATATTVSGWQFTLLTAVSAVIVVAIGYGGHRLSGARDYPTYLW